MDSVELSVVILVFNEGKNIGELITKLKDILDTKVKDFEILIIDGGSTDDTAYRAKTAGAIVHVQEKLGYGNALREGFLLAKGDYIITMDGDLSHEPFVALDLWNNRKNADIVIASRYIPKGKADISLLKLFLSTMLNKFFAFGLSMSIKDLSSGFRLYNRTSLKDIKTTGKDFDVLPEILVRAYSSGLNIIEIPFHYKERKEGKSKLRLLSFGMSYTRTFLKLCRLRSSIASVDYDNRAYNSIIPLQRYWQRKRKKLVFRFLEDENEILDIGSGTSKIIQNLPNCIALDISFGKLRYLKSKNGHQVVLLGDAKALPFQESSFRGVILSNVIEHVVEGEEILLEINRILKKNGYLILSTPDYGGVLWKRIEKIYDFVLPGESYAVEHISKYTRDSITRDLEKAGFQIIESKYILRSELIIKCIKK